MSTTPVAIITGAGSGIGRSLAVLLAQRGYALVLVGRTRSNLSHTASLTGAGERIEVAAGDVSDPFTSRHMVARAVERFGRLDALVNNAGLAPLSPIDRTTPEALERCFRINALAPGFATHFAWPVFARQHEAHAAGQPSVAASPPRATVVNVSTIGTLDPFPGFFAYAAAKAATNLMAASIAKEGAKIGVRGFAVAPGAVETEMLRALFPPSALPPSACLAPDDVARVIVSCIEGERDADNGRVIPVVPAAQAAWLTAWRAENPGGFLGAAPAAPGS
ncbi:MAG: SDR family oxidoreductase [Phycisphaerales bacterium]